jgi:UDP-N-acetylglucosamine--N-acetylmuramyl-(pentapeptide) pyrophosphoryl-undecaprenol N-acetylglucosamine transferase
VAPPEAPLRAVIAGGGTGGHGFPAVALATVLANAGDRAAIRLVGTRQGPEGHAASLAGIPFEAMDVIGFRRSLAPRALGRNVLAAGKAAGATLRSVRILRRERAQVAVGCGGYASIPVAVAAALTRTPLVLHEQNALPGRANRLAGRWAAAVAVSFPGSERYFPAGTRVQMTGNPIRTELAHLDRPALRPAALEHFGLAGDRRTLLVFGGSQGARRVNEAALGAYEHWRDTPGLQVLHVVGPRELPAAEQRLEELRSAGDELAWHLVGFTDRMDLAYAVADLAVCRAGAATLFEIAAAGLPAIVVPYPHAGDHQRYNAQPLVELDAIRMIPDAGCTPVTLAAAVDGLLADRGRLEMMSRRLNAFARPDAAEALAALVEEVARR